MTGIEASDVMSAMTGKRGPRAAMHFDKSKGVPEIVRRHALSAPEAIAIICDQQQMTYGELDRISDNLAAYLVCCGVAKGDVVCLFVPRALETVVAQLAILKAGAAYLPLDPAYPLEHLKYVVEECQPKVIFTSDEDLSRLASLGGPQSRTVDLVSTLRRQDRFDVPQFPAILGTDLAYVMYTSGSTGRPKGVAVPHVGITRLVLEQNFVNLGLQDVVLHSTTISFDASTMDVWGALLNGATLVIMAKANFSLTDIDDLIRKTGVTSATITTGLFNLLADYLHEELPSLRQIRFGGEVASTPHVKRFLTAHPSCVLTNVYGPTEAICIATTFDIPPEFSAGEVPIGRPIAHTQVYLLNDDFQAVGPGQIGQIAIAGDGLALGYYNRPDLTQDRFVVLDMGNGPVRCYLTGDMAVMDEDGQFHFRGRRDRQVKINGKRIELEEIEAALRRHPRLAEAVVECRECAGSKQIIAYLRPSNAQDLSNKNFIPSVLEQLRNSLPAYMVPNASLLMSEFPLTRAGKIDRASLPLPVTERIEATSIRSRSEEIVERLWRQALGLEVVPVDRNFFDLGGTSLQLMRVHAGLEAELGERCDLVALFKHTTIRDMARFLDGREQAPAQAAVADQRGALQRKTMAQFRRSTP